MKYNLKTEHERREILARLELSFMQINRPTSSFTADEINELVHLTCDINPHLIMGHAIIIQQAGLAKKYITDPNTRQLIDIWCNSDQYAGLSLTDFLNATDTKL